MIALDDPGHPVWLTFEAPSSDQPLRLCPAWTDPPGLGAQHPLGARADPRLADRSDAPLDTWRGNERSPGRLTRPHQADWSNNVHVIRIDDPDPGTYTVSVDPNIATFRYGLQPFALAIRGCRARLPVRRGDQKLTSPRHNPAVGQPAAYLAPKTPPSSAIDG